MNQTAGVSMLPLSTGFEKRTGYIPVVSVILGEEQRSSKVAKKALSRNSATSGWPCDTGVEKKKGSQEWSIAGVS